jgi:hypothetical protein
MLRPAGSLLPLLYRIDSHPDGCIARFGLSFIEWWTNHSPHLAGGKHLTTK